MKKLTADSPEAKSLDLVGENIAKLKALFPELLTEGKDGAAVNVDVLKQLVGDATVTDTDEKYGLTWNGKRKARLEALKPSTGTLRPAKDDSVEWDSTQNLVIEGDNLEVLKLLQKSYANQVKLIYIDPPYNTGKDFVYPDDYQDNLRNYKERQGTLGVEQNAESSGRFHTDWLNMMLPRLHAALNLLSPDGVLFVSIDDNELGNMKALLNEVFGEINFIGQWNWFKSATPPNLSKKIKKNIEYVLAFEKSKTSTEYKGVRKFSPSDDPLTKPQNPIKALKFPKGSLEIDLEDQDFKPGFYGTDKYPYELVNDLKVRGGKNDNEVEFRTKFTWTQPKLEMELLLGTRMKIASDRLVISYKKADYGEEIPPNLIDWSVGVGTNETSGKRVAELMDGQSVFDYPKPIELIEYLSGFCTSGSDIVLDFFAGSGTTGHAVMSQNAVDGGGRRFILVQLDEPLDPEKKEQKVAAEFCDKLGKPRTIAELTKERLRRAAKKVKAENPLFHGDLGFRVFKLDTSNLKAWDPNTSTVREDLLSVAEHVKPDRSNDDLLYELLLKKGLDLSVPMEQKTIAGQVVHAIGGGVMLVCLADAIDTKAAEPLALGIAEWHKQLAPANDKETVVVFKDSAFDSNVAKSNLTEILKQRGLEKVNSI